MKLFFIRNVGTVPRGMLEYIGMSDKRERMDDTRIIGHNGSGFKYAAAAALRMGISTAAASTDEEGSYFLDVESEPVTSGSVTGNRVCYRYWKPSKAAPDAVSSQVRRLDRVIEGFPNWDKPIGDDGNPLFKVLREHVCNAYDQDKDFRCGVTAKRHFSVPGETTVYLSHRVEIDRIIASPDRYFKFLSDHQPVAAVKGIGAVWPKSDPHKTRLFVAGVLAECSARDTVRALFDYSIDDKRLLSEERILKSLDTYLYQVARLLMALPDRDVCAEVLRGIAEGRAPLEEYALSHMRHRTLSDKEREAWLGAVADTFGSKIALPSDNDVCNSDARQIYGYTLVKFGSPSFRKFLANVGVPSADDVFPKNPFDRVEVVQYDDLDASSRLRFRTAYGLFRRCFPERAGLPVGFFHPLDASMAALEGFSGHGESHFREIWIKAAGRALPSVREVLKTLVHESRHCASRTYDHERGFVEAAEEDIASLCMRLFPGPTADPETRDE